MAKKEMICPFSGKRCRNCSLYIGRHYFLCYKTGYRGYLTGAKEGGIKEIVGVGIKRNLDVPKLPYRESLDLYVREI